MDKQAYEASIRMVLEKRAAGKTSTDETHAVNSILALSGLGGTAALGNTRDNMGSVGSFLAGGSVVGGGMYHTARLLNAPKALRIAALLTGYISGGVIGNRVYQGMV